MTSVVVTGAHGPLGRRVCRRVAAVADLDRLVRMASIPAEDPAELKRVFDGVDVLIHLGTSMGPELDGTGAPGVDVAGTRCLLDAAGSVGVEQVVVLSSAMVYGAWADNPVPLTEDAPLRPNPELTFAVRKAEVERLALEWSADHPGSSVAVLRPTVGVAEETTAWMARSLWQTGAVRPDDLEPPGQFLHLDDLASAIDLAWRESLDGAFNVAPDGWIPPEQIRALAPAGLRLRVPGSVASAIASWRWRLGLTPTPPEMLPYTMHPWVVANDRIRARGWKPTNSNEEAFVAGVRAGPLATLNPRRRQELALGAAGALVLGVTAAGVALVVRARHRR